jgi:hypothetical protein
MTTTASEKAEPICSNVKIWGSRRSPSWAITIAEGTSDEELGRITRAALETWRQLGSELRPETPADVDEDPGF